MLHTPIWECSHNNRYDLSKSRSLPTSLSFNALEATRVLRPLRWSASKETVRFWSNRVTESAFAWVDSPLFPRPFISTSSLIVLGWLETRQKFIPQPLKRIQFLLPCNSFSSRKQRSLLRFVTFFGNGYSSSSLLLLLGMDSPNLPSGAQSRLRRSLPIWYLFTCSVH